MTSQFIENLASAFSNNNLTLLIFAAIPAIVYAFIIYLTSPYKSIRLDTSVVYFVIGCLSVLLVQYFGMIFPDWYDVAPTLNSKFGDWKIDQLFVKMFFRVAFLEELCKLATFTFTTYILTKGYSMFNKKIESNGIKISPFGIMFYAAMNALGFAFIENLGYGYMYGEGVLVIRTFTALILHMLTGLFLGYWIALGRFKHNLGDRRSVFDVYMRKFPVLKFSIYTGLGLLSVIILHGLYNFTVSLPNVAVIPIMFIIIIFSIIGSYFAGLDIIKRSRATLNNCSEANS